MSTLKVDAIRHNSATSDAITTASDGTCNARLTSVGGGGLSHRNIVINGAMSIAQRATSSTAGGGYNTVDRIDYRVSGADETPTQSQVDVASGTTPYTLGFRKAFRFTNGNQTGGANAGDYLFLFYQVEAQDIVQSGWDYKSSTNFITLSFWVKSSVAQNFYGYIRSRENTEQSHSYETGTLSANTWTKVTKTFSGNSNIVMANDNGQGLGIYLAPFFGTDSTDNSKGTTAWSAYSHSTRTPDNTSTWWTTNDATFEITGLQLEVGDTATSFEHRSYGEELRRCERYFEKHWQNNNSASPGGAAGDGYNTVANGTHNGSNGYYVWRWRTQKRALPTISHGGKFRIFGASSHSNKTVNEFYSPGLDAGRLRVNHSGSAGQSFILEFDGANSSDGYIQADAEL